MDFPVTLIIPELNPPEFTLNGIARTLVDNMIGHVQSGLMEANREIDTSVASGTAPIFDGSSWFSREPTSHAFKPINIRVNNVLLQSTPTADRRQLLNNKDGTIALLDDVYGIKNTVIVQEGLVSVDWNSGKDFMCVLSGNRRSTFYMFHSKPGMEIDLLLVNNGTNQLVNTWDPLIHWPTDTPPVVPAANTGTSAMLKVNLVNVAGIIYGEFINYTDVTPWSITDTAHFTQVAQPVSIS